MTSETAGPRKRESHLWDRDPQDFYVEPEWCSRRLFAVEKFDGGVLDPACGGGNIIKSARAADMHAVGSDLVSRADGMMYGLDFLSSDYPMEICFTRSGGECSNIVSNPPFKLAEQFVAKALAIAERKVAMLLPSKWIQGQKRSRWLQSTPLYRVYFICPRPSMPPGHVLAAGQKPGNGTADFAWFVWLRGFEGDPTIQWLYREDPPQAAAQEHRL